ncbi:MAG: hypothetical protein UE295_00875 [Acutalibacteraceae bacterium]|nr:hypothetical protein [Acutalibacteraceae bacterium]
MSNAIARKKKVKKKPIIITIIVILIIGGLIAGLSYKKYTDSFAKVVSVQELTSMFSSESMGKVFSRAILQEDTVQKLNVKNELSIKEVKVAKGDTVEKGDVLVEYDTEILQLAVDTCQTGIDKLSNSIKIAENELNTLKGLIPAEKAPATEPPTLPIEFETEEDIIPPVVEYETVITTSTKPISGDGSANSPFIFNVGLDTVVKPQFMQYLAGDKANTQPTASNSKYAMFHVYGEGILLYSWLVDGSLITESDIDNWYCGAGVEISEAGSIQVAPGVNPFASLITYSNFEIPQADNNDLESLLGDNLNLEDILAQLESENDFADDGEITANDNYIFTQAELQEMINAKNDEIAQLNFEKRQTEIELKQAKERLKTGNEIAKIRGTVTFVADSIEEAIKNGSYITIVNDSVTSVTAVVKEKELENLKLGMKAILRVDYQELDCKGTIIEISDEISKHLGYDMFGVTDETSVYFDVKVQFDEKLTIDDKSSIEVMFDTGEAQESIWLESSFVRTENGKSYILVADENNMLEKRYVKVADKFFTYAVMVVGDISMDDRIALPYGNSTVGKPTRDSSFSEIYSGFFF